MQATADFIQGLASAPSGAEASIEVPEPVKLELATAGIGIGTFLKLLPQIMALVKMFTDGTATIGEIIAAVVALLSAFKGSEG